MRVALGRLSIVLLAWTVSAVAPVAAQQPQPDPAPQAATIAPDPAPGVDPFETFPVAVANEFFSDGQAAEVRAPGAPTLADLCRAGLPD